MSQMGPGAPGGQMGPGGGPVGQLGPNGLGQMGPGNGPGSVPMTTSSGPSVSMGPGNRPNGPTGVGPGI